MSGNYFIRRAADTSFRAFRRAQSALKSRKTITNLVYFPLIRSEKTLADILNRANWYFPGRGPSQARITIPVSSTVSTNVSHPKTQGNFIRKNPRIVLKKTNQKELEPIAKKADAILLWDKNFFFRIPSSLFRLDRIWIVDPDYLTITETRNYVRLHNATIPKKASDSLLRASLKNFSSLPGQYKNSYVFGTGPSIKRAYEFDYSDGLRVIANTVINDRKLMKKIKPHIVVFGDFAYHIGPSKYASRFRRQLIGALSRGMTGVTRFDVMPLMLAHYPELRSRLIGLPVKNFSMPNIPTPERFFVKLSNNSLITFMLPLASSLTQNVNILGCDGRKPTDRLFWSHAKSTHYDEMTQTIVDTNPSYFRDTNFKKFYLNYCRDTRKAIEYGESLGIRYKSLTRSYIPTLRQRG